MKQSRRLAELSSRFDEALRVVHTRLRDFTQVARSVVKGHDPNAADRLSFRLIQPRSRPFRRDPHWPPRQ